MKRLKDLCANDSWKVSKYAARALLRLRESSEEMQSVVKSSLSSLSLSAQLPSALCSLSEAARRSPSLLATKDQEKLLTVSQHCYFSKSVEHDAF